MWVPIFRWTLAQLTLKHVRSGILLFNEMMQSYHMNIPRLWEAHRGFLALQSAHISKPQVKVRSWADVRVTHHFLVVQRFPGQPFGFAPRWFYSTQTLLSNARIFRGQLTSWEGFQRKTRWRFGQTCVLRLRKTKHPNPKSNCTLQIDRRLSSPLASRYHVALRQCSCRPISICRNT